MTTEETLEAEPKTTGLALRVVLGARVISRDLPDEGSLVIGRDESSDLALEHLSVSRRHAQVTTRGGEAWIRDLGSANGTIVAEARCEPDVDVRIRPGDAIELGDVLVILQRGQIGGAPATATAIVSLEHRSPAMLAVDALIERVAPAMINVLIVGETGVGKEVVAEQIHRRSRRARKPFVRLNCAAVVDQLLESEWFGHERGAFSGAYATKPGLIETADGGTVLLDEIGELPLPLQAKMLRMLEDRAVMHVGGLRMLPIDVRFIAATNRNLAAEIEAKTFRRDLYFRLNGVTLSIPPLRERAGEIEALALGFIDGAARSAGREPPQLAPRARELLLAYDWPGNVRELRQVMERAVLLADDVIGPAALPDTLVAPSSVSPATLPSSSSPRAVLEKERVLDALHQAHGNQKRAAEILGISRGTLLARLDAFGISRPRKSFRT